MEQEVVVVDVWEGTRSIRIRKGELLCINNGSYMKIDLSHGKYSMLDLTLVSEHLAGKCDWKVLKQSTIDSTIGVEIARTVVERISRWRFK